MLGAMISAALVPLAAASQPEPGASRSLETYLQRPVTYAAMHLDHGVVSVEAAGGHPHRYRIGVAVGLLDHLTLGATAHWLPRESLPKWSPRVAVAFYRSARVDVGARYFWVLHPTADESIATSTQWVLGTASFSHRWLSGGFDVGVYRARVIDPAIVPAEGETPPSVIVWRAGGGLHLRAGTRRWGFTAQALAPRLFAELVFDVRFGAFEHRSRGGWRPRGVVWSTDRRVPPWRSKD